MKISLDWLREFVTWEGTPAELAEKLTCLGLNVEGIDTYSVSFPNVLVGEVREVIPHPDADRLSLCTVWDGQQTHAVVCGASNVRPELKVLLALPGAKLPNGLEIKHSKIRGVESQGMICSADELELHSDASGIMELDAESIPGTPADDLYGYQDSILDIEVTPNRPDWLSHLGVAREVGILNETKISPPPVWTEQVGSGDPFEFGVEIENFDDCPRYTAHGALQVQVGPSPAFIRNRLQAVGSRPINNVVDITNYVMLESGQPLHAFDRNKLNGSRIIVRRAGNDKSIRTLDDVVRTLRPDDLVIADASGPVAVAGVIGGDGSQIDDSSDELILESAFFNPQIVRQTRRDIGVSTDSSYRFEREADWDMVDWAARRALYLFQRHASAQILSERVDRQNPDRRPREDVPLRVGQVNRLLGTNLDSAEVVRLLQHDHLKVTPLGQASDRDSGAASLMVAVPSFRRDLNQEVDLIEEVARVHGYDQVPSQGQFRGGPGGESRLTDHVVAKIRKYLASVGYYEISTSSFFASEDLDRLGLADDDVRRQCLQIANPHHGGDILLRTSPLPSLLRTMRHNINADNILPVKMFQIARVFWPASPGLNLGRHAEEALLPAEPIYLQYGLAGPGKAGVAGVPQDLLEIKGITQTLAKLLRVPLKLVVHEVEPFLEPGQQWRIEDAHGREVGCAGTISTSVCQAYDLELPVVLAQLRMDLLDLEPMEVRFQPFSRFPAVKRDMSLVVPEGVGYNRLEEVVRDTGGDLLESMELFDYYAGKEVAESVNAIGIRLKFRSNKGNLKGKTVDKTISRIQDALAQHLNVRMRT